MPKIKDNLNVHQQERALEVLVYSYNGILPSNEICVSWYTMWINFKIITQSERVHNQKTTYCLVPLI